MKQLKKFQFTYDLQGVIRNHVIYAIDIVEATSKWRVHMGKSVVAITVQELP